jgi:predicted RND superfamily exporter protein
LHRLTSISLQWPRLTLALVLAITAVAGWLALGVKTVTGASAELGADHPVIREFEELLGQFGGGYPVIIAWSCAETNLCESVFDPESLRMAYEVSRTLERSSAVQRVSSPATSSVLIPIADEGFESRPLVLDGEVAPDHQHLKQHALADPLWRGSLISDDAVVGAIVVEMVSTESGALFTVVRDIREALAPMQRRGFRYHLVGQAIVEVAFHETGSADAAKLGGFTSAVICLTIFLLTRSWQAVIGVMASIGCATAWMMGCMRVFGWDQGPFTMAAPTVVLVVGAADAIHVFGRYAAERSRQLGREPALLRACQAVGPPCIMTTLTTGAAFLSFAAGESIGMARFGVLAAIGVCSALALCFSLLPVLLALLPLEGPGAHRVSAAWQTVLDQLVTVGTRRSGIVLVAAGALTILCGLGVPKLQVETDPYSYWGPEEPVPRWARFVGEHLREPDSVEVALTLPEGATILDPEALRHVGSIATFLSSIEGLGRTHSVLGPITRANRLLHDDDPAFERLPETQQAVGELLTLISFGSPAVLDPWLSLDHRQVRLSTEARNLNQAGRAHVLDHLRRYLTENVPMGWSYTVTGPLVLFYQFAEGVNRTQFRSFSTAALVVFALLAVFLRSLRWGALAMIPNLIPVIVLLGILGHWGIYLDGGTAMVAPIAIGIAVDDTIHLLNQYALQRRAGHASLPAIQAAMRAVGRPVITTTAALSLGFLTMLTSSFQSIANIGLLSAVAVLGALVADLLVLPALIAVAARREAA